MRQTNSALASGGCTTSSQATASTRFFECLPHRLGRDLRDLAQFHQGVGQQPQGPPLAARWRLATGQGDQVGLLVAVELPGAVLVPGAWGQSRRESLLDEALADARDGGQADIQGEVDL